eukprot:COSAG06_NODE_5818_length_3257_cov_38.925586_1_plen_63_part_10
MVEATSRISLEVHQSTPQLSWVHQVFHCARQRAERMRGERHEALKQHEEDLSEADMKELWVEI